MTLAEASEIFAYWADNPPAHLMLQTIARMLGWRPRTGEKPADIAAAPPPGLVVAAGGGSPMPAPEWDIEALRANNRRRAEALARDREDRR